jgi:hypothetical protein
VQVICAPAASVVAGQLTGETLLSVSEMLLIATLPVLLSR